MDEIGGDLHEVFGRFVDPVEEARALVSPQEHARAVDEGRAMSVEEQVAYALEPLPDR